MRLAKLPVSPFSLTVLVACGLSGTADGSYGTPTDRAANGAEPRFEAVLVEQVDRLARVTDDAAALGLYREALAETLQVSDTVPLLSSSPRRSRGATAPPPDLQSPALSLVKALIRWETARSLRAAAEGEDASALAAIPAREGARRAWLAGDDQSPALDRALKLAEVVAAFAATEGLGGPASPQEVEQATALDRRYPNLADGEDSWVEVAVRDGPAGVLRRLGQDDTRQDAAATPPHAAVRYFHSRLRPVLLAGIVAATMRAEADARRRATGDWDRLATWRETWSTTRGLARLCGTWQWVLHNHQNHQDQKMVLIFPPPEAERSGPALPKRAVVLGDSVYLRWEFPGGYQEDSLLFSGQDRRLEGTFVNSQGPHGAVTGKRVRPCGAEP